VSQTVEVDDLLLPRNFSLVLYRPNYESSSAKSLVPVAKWAGQVTRASSKATSGAIVFEPQGRTMVRDMRFVNTLTNFKTLNYFVTNAWLGANDPVLIQKVANARLVKPEQRPTQKMQRKWFLFFIALVLLVPIFMNSRQRIKKRKTPHSLL
jgi:hypothetical protein